MSWSYLILMNIHFFSQTPSMYSEIVQIPLPLDVIYHCSVLAAFDCSGLHSRLVHYLKQTGIFSYCTQYHIQLHIGLSVNDFSVKSVMFQEIKAIVLIVKNNQDDITFCYF